MIAAGSQCESPGGSAQADTLCVLRFLSLHQCPHLCWSDPSPQPHVRDRGHRIWGCGVDRMQIVTRGLRQSLTFPPVNCSAHVYKCICNL